MVSSIQGISSIMGSSQQVKAASLTEDQKQTIQDILSQYDADNVTTEDAKAIFQAFSDAGITPARGMKEAIEAAGFDAEDLRAKGMPENMPPAPPPPSSQSSSLDTEALQELEDILSQYDLSNLTDEDKKSLMQQLQQNGLIDPGSIVDMKS